MMRATPVAVQVPRDWRQRLGIAPGTSAAIAAMVAVGIAISLVAPLVSLTLSARGVSERTIGIVVSTYAVAMLAITPQAGRIAAQLGTANSIALLTAVSAVLIPFVWIVKSVAWLFPVMFAYGGCVSLCFTLSEFWIANNTPDDKRGFVIGLYATLLSIGFAIGPAIIAGLGAYSIYPFLVGSALMLLATLTAILARNASPIFAGRPHIRFSAYLLAAPVATVGALVFAMGESGGFAFLPLWGEHLGFSPALAVLLASAMTLGNVVFQIPVGLLADRMDRRLLLFGCAVVGALGMLLAWAVTESPAALIAVLFIWGGATAGIYTVGLAHLASRFSTADLVGANAAFVFCYALGMLVGPLAIGDAMDRAPTTGFPLVLGTVFVLYAILVAARMVRR
jgi:MFS family permease